MAYAAAGFLNVGLGLWSLFAPQSFFEMVATYPPYNAHLLHDLGTMTASLGGALLLALFWRDPLLVVLVAVASAASIHALVHVADRSLGGRPTDPLFLGGLAVALIGLAIARWREVRRGLNASATARGQ